MLCLNSTFEVDEIHDAKRGVTFHKTAPVVPPPRFDDNIVGD